VGLVTFDSSVHFYNVSKGQAQPQMLVMPDTQDVYAPMPSQLLAKLSECREQLAELLASIPTMFAATTGPESCGAAAIEVRREAREDARAGQSVAAAVRQLAQHACCAA
jgi:protein transport protein SEC24